MPAELLEALEYEGQEAVQSLEEMMAEMLGNVEKGGDYVRDELDEYTVRKMLLARNYTQKDIEKMQNLKSAIVMDWDRRINNKKKDITNIEDMVDGYVRKQNKGKTLALDVATASLKRYGHKVKVKDKADVRAYFEEKNMLDKFLKPAQLDETLAQNHFMNLFESKVNKIVEDQVEYEIKQSEKNKITKKRQKEILLEVIEKELPAFNEELPKGFELVMPEEKLSIRTNI